MNIEEVKSIIRPYLNEYGNLYSDDYEKVTKKFRYKDRAKLDGFLFDYNIRVIPAPKMKSHKNVERINWINIEPKIKHYLYGNNKISKEDLERVFDHLNEKQLQDVQMKLNENNIRIENRKSALIEKQSDGEETEKNINEGNKYNQRGKKIRRKELNEELCDTYQKGNIKVLGEIIDLNSDIIERIIKKKYQKDDWMFEIFDYIQYAYIGIMKAALNYRKEDQYSFRKYAGKLIEKEIDESIMSFQNIDNNLQVDKMDSSIESDKIIFMEISEFEKVIKQNIVSPYKIIERKELMNDFKRILETLDSKEKMIIEMRCGFGNCDPMTLSEIGDKFNLSRERIRQIEKKAIKRLRHPSRSKILRDFRKTI